MKWKVTAPHWARSNTGHGICKAKSGRYAAWRESKFLGFANTSEQAKRICIDDLMNGKRK